MNTKHGKVSEHQNTHFLTEAMMIDRLLEFSRPPKGGVSLFHELVEAFRDKDPDLFFSLLAELPKR